MAHRIQDGMIAWKGETPWQGLGTKVEQSMSGAEMLVVAKMDWQVQRRMLAMRDSAGVELLTAPLENYRSIVRADNDKVFQIAKKGYHPVQNAEIVEFFREYCEAGHATMETVGGIDGGGKVWALARLNGGSSAELAGGDQLRGYMLLATSHDGSLRTIGKPTQVRVVCWNTLAAALQFIRGKLGKADTTEFRMRHTKKWSPAVADEARRIMGMASAQVAATNELAGKLSKVAIDDKGRMEFVKRLIGGESILEQIATDASVPSNGSGLLDSILDRQTSANEPADLKRLGKAFLDAMTQSPGADMESAKGTLWGAVNGVTYHVDHERGRSQDTRLSNAWFGDGDRLKRDAVNIAVELAGLSQ